MHPFHKALHKKKMEGLMISIHPASHTPEREEMQQAAARGDGAPEVLDKTEDPSLTGEGSPMEEAGESPEMEAQEDAQPHQASHKPPVPHPHHKKPSSLREKAEIEMKKKGY